ncbi:MAG TPA: ribbon-helix-helix protein, CopG family [Thermoanaerobaculia bacterium]|nr:ribbon-helix-helix protein, CopG family [Thermoanaerobaculia bacterium]
MSTKPVQVSIETELLTRIDRDPEARERGRSAFIRSAVELYLAAKGRRELEAQLANAYDGRADALLDEVMELLGRQSWPND